jgi:hypothetical protein
MRNDGEDVIQEGRAKVVGVSGDAHVARVVPRGDGVCPTCNRPFAERRSCLDCTIEFEITPGERDFFIGKGFSLPVRCRACRAVRRDFRAREAVRPESSAAGPRRTE